MESVEVDRALKISDPPAYDNSFFEVVPVDVNGEMLNLAALDTRVSLFLYVCIRVYQTRGANKLFQYSVMISTRPLLRPRPDIDFISVATPFLNT